MKNNTITIFFISITTITKKTFFLLFFISFFVTSIFILIILIGVFYQKSFTKIVYASNCNSVGNCTCCCAPNQCANVVFVNPCSCSCYNVITCSNGTKTCGSCPQSPTPTSPSGGGGGGGGGNPAPNPTPTPPCISSAPIPAMLNYPYNQQIIYSSYTQLSYNVNNGWGNSCGAGPNTYRVFLSSNCSNIENNCNRFSLTERCIPPTYTNLGPVTGISGFQRNTSYCWRVEKSNGTTSSMSQIFSFRTSSDIIVNVQSNLPNNFCSVGWVGRLGSINVTNPVSWTISGSIPTNLNLQYVSFALVPRQSENNQLVNKNTIFSKATNLNNANSVAVDIYQNQILLYTNQFSFQTSNNFSNSVSPFGNYIIRNVNFQRTSTNYSVTFSIEFLNNFRNGLYKIYSMAVYTDPNGQQISTYGFSSNGQLMMFNKNEVMGDGMWGIDMEPPAISSSFIRGGSFGEIIRFDSQTYNNAMDSISGVNQNFRYASIRSFIENSSWRQNNIEFTVLNQNHPNFSILPVHRNPSVFDPVNSSNVYTILNKDLSYQVRLGILDNACNFGFTDLNIDSAVNSWMLSLWGNTYASNGFVNLRIPDSAQFLNYDPFNINVAPFLSSYGNFLGLSNLPQKASRTGFVLNNYLLESRNNFLNGQSETNEKFYTIIKDLLIKRKKTEIINFDSVTISEQWVVGDSFYFGIFSPQELKNTNPNNLPFITLSNLFSFSNGQSQQSFVPIQFNKNATFAGNINCDRNYVLFFENKVYFNVYNFITSNDSICIIVSKEDININSLLSSVVTSSPQPIYNFINATFVSDKNIFLNVEGPDSVQLDIVTDARPVLIRGSLISNGNIFFNGRLDNNPDQNQFKPTFVIEYDPLIRKFIVENNFSPRKIKIIED